MHKVFLYKINLIADAFISRYTITVYAAAAFVILELTDIVAPSLGLPDWTLNFIFILLLTGFIIAVISSWVYDLHPEVVCVLYSVFEKSIHSDSKLNRFTWFSYKYAIFLYESLL